MFRSLAISAYFIQKGLQESSPVSPMKLQKLLYFSHGWHLAYFKSPLLYEEFEAWKFGPVLPNVYYHFKSYGPFPIKEIPAGIAIEDLYTVGVTNFLKAIWDRYHPYSAEQLSALTHLDDSPWKKVYSPKAMNIPIPNGEIERYFVELKSQQDEPATAGAT